MQSRLPYRVAAAGRWRGGLVSHRRAGSGRCEAVPCRAGWHKQQAPSPGNEENVMNYHGLVKRLDLPAGRIPPG